MVGRPAPPSPSMHNGINAENTAEHLDTAHRKQAAGPLTMQASLAQMSPCIETDTRTGTHNSRWERQPLPAVATQPAPHLHAETLKRGLWVQARGSYLTVTDPDTCPSAPKPGACDAGE